MAGSGYDINLNIALKNSQKLKQLKNDLTDIAGKQKDYNKQVRDSNKIAVATFNKLNRQLLKAKGLLNKAAYGTDSFKRAARALVNVEKEHNHQLKEKERILNKLRREINDPTYELRQQRKQQIRENIRQNRALRFTNVNPSRPAVVGDYGQSGGRIGPAQALNNSQGGFLAFSKAADKIGIIQKETKKIAVSTKKSSQILSQQATAANFSVLTGQAQGFLPGSGFGMAGGQIGPRQPLRNRLGFGKNALPGPFAMQGGAMGRLKGGVGSAMIGGGFPALFGAGGLSSVLGGLAGGIGGALAPGGGFAASIFATAIASEIEKVKEFRKAVRTLNEDLKNAGAITQISRKEIKQLARDLDITKEEATALVAQFSKFADVGGLDLARLFGSRDLFDATVGLNDFSSTLTRIQQLSEQLTLGTEFEAYKILSEEGSEAANDFIINSLLAAKQADVFTDRFEEDLKRVERLEGVASGLRFANPLADISTFTDEFRNIVTTFAKENVQIQEILKDESRPLADKLKDIDAILMPMIQNTDALKIALSKLPPEFDLSTEAAKNLVDELSKNVENLRFLEEFHAPTDQLREMLNPLRRILDLSVAIKDGFEGSFKGLIKGTMSVQDAFRNMFNRIADHYADMVAKMLATQIQKGFLSMFASMFSFGGFEFGKNKASDYLGDVGNPLSGRASGGPVSGGKPYIVGEEGPEVFTPGVSGGITPNHALGGSTNISVNIDASGTSVQGSEPNGEELGRLVAAAIQSELIKEKRPGGLLS